MYARLRVSAPRYGQGAPPSLNTHRISRGQLALNDKLCHAANSIAAHLRLASIGVEYAHAHIGIGVRVGGTNQN